VTIYGSAIWELIGRSSPQLEPREGLAGLLMVPFGVLSVGVGGGVPAGVKWTGPSMRLLTSSDFSSQPRLFQGSSWSQSVLLSHLGDH
jgi:hypothetical protein